MSEITAEKLNTYAMQYIKICRLIDPHNEMTHEEIVEYVKRWCEIDHMIVRTEFGTL